MPKSHPNVSWLICIQIIRLKVLVKNFVAIIIMLSSVLSSVLCFAGNNESYYKQFRQVFETIEANYVNEADKQKMLDGALSGMLSSLDPYSMYLVDDALEEFDSHVSGEFAGIGVEFYYDAGVAKIIAPIDGLAADRAGIKAGDSIVAVDDEAVSDLGYHQVIKKIRGAAGTPVSISIVRDGEKKVLKFDIIREIVKITPIKYHVENNIAYIRIVTFSENTIDDLHKAMSDISTKGAVKGIILDMRNNPGGLVTQAIEVGQYFMDSGVIMRTKGRTPHSISVAEADPKCKKAPKVPMVVLVNGGSASAAELVAGALQDNKRAIIMGTKTFGKGSVQVKSDITPKHSAIKLTIAKFYTPNGKEIQAEGITPDIITEQAVLEYNKEASSQKFSETSLKNSLKNDQKKKDSSSDKKSSATVDKNLEIDESKSEKEGNAEELKALELKSDFAKKYDPKEMYKKDYQYSKAYDLLIGLTFKY
jgi:carboxyl-terminal processing protease